ncbi:MAG TPA: adenylate/guanylate cyclase domain-containing protein [Acidimicrobiia bacterium]|nr:adenylate/guanylate cyclase domain-containing protein [Acidimicrobiia bacterium]
MADLEAEKARSEALLRNVLPERIIERLNNGEASISDRFDDVAVLFTDLVSFTEMSAISDPAVVVGTLNALFSRFDQLSVDLGVEKIKTIGDAYMAAAGLLEHRDDHIDAAVRMGIGMLAALEDVNTVRGSTWSMRVGIHAGPVMAGIIGTRKYVYDVWGDTVNTASRLQTTAPPGTVHLTRAVAERLDPAAFIVEGHDALELRGLGVVETCRVRLR